MARIERIADFRVSEPLGASYHRLIEAARGGTFGAALLQAVRAHTRGVRRFYLYDAKGSADSLLRYHACEPQVAALFPLYDGHYRRLDPVCDAYRAAPRVGDMVMQRVRPSDILSAGFRRRFFDDAGIIERISIVQRGPTSWRAMNLARHRSDGYFSDAELDNIVGLAALALPMVALDTGPSPNGPSLDINQLELRFEASFPALSLRERQVCARAARGMTVEATALDLGIGKASVLTYRRRAYQRLGVSSAFELGALVSR